MSKCIPCDTRKAIGSHIPDNFALALNKYGEYENGKFIIFRDGNKKKNISAYDIAKYFTNNTECFNSIIKRAENAADGICKKVMKGSLEIDWRMVVGIGHESVYETSMTLHHIYGFPYIPGQALKGIMRSHIIAECFENDKKKAEDDGAFKLIFGTTDAEGGIIFFDALPQVINIKSDVMNPHYGEYYQDKKGKTPPADYLKTKPIFFLTVGGNSKFNVIIGQKQNEDKTEILNASPIVNNVEELKTKKNLTPLDVTQYWLKEAMAKHGVGAKTSVGYGRGVLTFGEQTPS